MSHSSSPRMQIAKLTDSNEPWLPPSPDLPIYDDYQIQTITTYVPYNVYIPVGVPIMPPPPKRLHRFFSTLGRKHKRFPRYPSHGMLPPPMCYPPVFQTSLPNYPMAVPYEEIAAFSMPHMMGHLESGGGLPMYPPFPEHTLHS